MWWLAFAVLLLIGAALLAVALRWEADAGIPGGRVVSIDLEHNGQPAPAMVEERLGLSGRPDALLELRGEHIPVEIKSGKAPAAPHRSHVLQLAAYCLLTEATYDRRPRRGILRYSDRTYSLPYTRSLERELLRVLGHMHALAGRLPDRSHEDPARCAACGYTSACDQRLAAREDEGGAWL